MDGIFVIKLMLSFVVGSVWVTSGTVIAERFGSRIGGFVAGLPSTIVLGLFFIAWTQSANVAADATTVVPIVGGVNCLFIVSYIMLVRINFWLALSGALAVWFALALALIFFRFNDFAVSISTYVLLLFFSFYFVEKKLKIKSEESKKVKLTISLMLIRGILSGLIVTLAVVLARIGGPILGGVFTMFPAMFTGTLLITYFSHGAGFSSAVMKASILGAIGVVIYGVIARYTFVPFGIWIGTGLSILISFGCAFIIHNVFTRKIT